MVLKDAGPNCVNFDVRRFNLTFFLKGCFSCNENLDSVLRDTVSVITDFLCSFRVCWDFRAEDCSETS